MTIIAKKQSLAYNDKLGKDNYFCKGCFFEHDCDDKKKQSRIGLQYILVDELKNFFSDMDKKDKRMYDDVVVTMSCSMRKEK